MKKIALSIFVVFSQLAFGQLLHPDILHKKWKAYWIAVPAEPESEYGVYKFRKVFELTQQPESFIIHVSADNRYKLFVNGQLASLGPARGDQFHWNFESVDIAAYLKKGNNVIGAVVWNFGPKRPEAQISLKTAFILQGNTFNEEMVNTNKSWKCIKDESYSPMTPDLLYTYYVSGPGEKIDFHRHISGWEKPGYDDASWREPRQISNGVPKGVFDWGDGWMLVPRGIPPMELTHQRLASARKSEGINVGKKFPKEKADVVMPPNKKVRLWLDQGYLTNAYPVLHFSKGSNAIITLTYAEALYKIENSGDWKTEKQKGNRDEVEGKRFVGVSDQLTSSGADGQLFTALWWRTYRYIQLEIETKEDPLTIHDVYGLFTGYPFKLDARFAAADKTLERIFETGWRTARLCAVETYMDCPYYEQLQYIGDTRIQALVSLFNSSDDRLVRNAITQLDYSRFAEGLTQSRYPTAHPQLIPPFSLWWIGMLHDYWMYRPDEKFVKDKLPGVRQVLNFFSNYQQPDGSLKNVPYWTFTDWVQDNGWQNGMAPVGSDQSSAILDLQLCLAFKTAAELEEKAGMNEFAILYREKAEQIKNTVRTKYWNDAKEMFSDTSDKTFYSQHTNTLAVLSEVIAGDEAKVLMEKILMDTSIAQATIYFKYYVHVAAVKTGLGDQYLDLLNDWREQLKGGLTTWAEISDHNNARSDCHAWGASPNIEFMRVVLGINSDAPGFSKLRIEPHPGKLTHVQGTMPHPRGEISANYSLIKGKWKIEISIPDVAGILVWKGREYKLNAGELNTFDF